MSNPKSLRRKNSKTSGSWREKSMLMLRQWRKKKSMVPNSNSRSEGPISKRSNSTSWRRKNSMGTNSNQTFKFRLNPPNKKSTNTKKYKKPRTEEIKIDDFIDNTDPNNKSIIISDVDLTINDVNEII